MHKSWTVHIDRKEISFTHSSGEAVTPITHGDSEVILLARIKHKKHTDVLIVVRGCTKKKAVKIYLDDECYGKVYLTVVVVGERMACDFDHKPTCADEWYVKSCETKKLHYKNSCNCGKCDSCSSKHDSCSSKHSSCGCSSKHNSCGCSSKHSSCGCSSKHSSCGCQRQHEKLKIKIGNWKIIVV